MADPISFRRKRLPATWQPYVRRRGPGAAAIRQMVWLGLVLGSMAFQATRFWPTTYSPPEATAPPAIETPHPYAEARRSRAILEAQEARAATTPAVDAGNSVHVPGPVHVIDGDTLVADGVRVRIADIDTPEIHGRCPYETELAARATQRMRTLLAAGPFELHPLPSGRDEDRYGRKLRIVTRDGRSLGDVLVAEGLARTWTGRREPWCV